MSPAAPRVSAAPGPPRPQLSAAGGPRAFDQWLPLALLVALAFVLYFNALANPFIIDDPMAIEDHPDVTRRSRLVTLWVHDYWAGRTEDRNLYRPVTVLTFNLNHAVTGLSPVGFRIVNVALLAGCGVVLALWLRRYVSGHAAWLAAMVWTAHPAHTEVINHVVGRADLLALLGVLGFLLAQRMALERGGWSWSIGFAAGVAALVAMGAKESGLVVVPLAVAQAFVTGRSPNDAARPSPRPSPSEGRGGAERASRPRRLTVWLPLALPLLLYVLGRAVAVGFAPDYGPSADDLTSNPLRGLTLLERLPAALAILAHYARQVGWPDTSFNQIPTQLASWSSPSTWEGIALLLGLLIGLACALRRRSWLALPAMLALSYYAIVGNLLTPTGAYAANRLALPFTAAAACALAALLGRAAADVRVRVAAALAIAIMAFGVLGANVGWGSEVLRMHADLRRQPGNPVALYHYGVAEVFAAQRSVRASKPAIDALESAVRLRPESVQARKQLANAYAQANELDAAAREFEWVAQRRPGDWESRIVLAQIAQAQGRWDDARRWYEEAQSLVPTNAHVLLGLADVAQAQERYLDAVRGYEALLRAHPRHEPGRTRYNELRRFLREQQ